jgi:hypothetical protein
MQRRIAVSPILYWKELQVVLPHEQANAPRRAFQLARWDFRKHGLHAVWIDRLDVGGDLIQTIGGQLHHSAADIYQGYLVSGR